MRDELKARIAQINAGTAPAGYKKTKVGIVPEEWEVTRFASISQKTGSERNDSDCAYPVYSINNKTGFAPQGDQFENDGYSNTSKDLYRIVRKGEFAYNPARINVGSIGLLSDVDAVIISSLYVCFKLNDKCYNPYFWQYFKSHRFNFDVNNYTEGSVREYLFYDNFARIRVAVPPLPEQQKIAEILTAQDAVIALMQKQIELLQKQKKAFLQKMFPKNGCNVPEIRFAGFTDAWEQRKLGELFEIIDTKHATAPVSEVQTKYRMIRTNCIRNGQLVVDNTDSVIEEVYEKWSERIHLRAGDLVFTREAPLGESAVIPEDEHHYFPGQRIVSMRSRGNVNTLFINQLFYADEFRKEIKIREAASTTVANFGIPSIKSQDVLIPCLNEQLSIGEFFSHIDNLITLHQRKLEQEQQKKKALMQLLLSGKVRVES